jgi:hypothetical protein
MFFSWEIFLELLIGRQSRRAAGRRSLEEIEGPANWENWPEPLAI